MKCKKCIKEKAEHLYNHNWFCWRCYLEESKSISNKELKPKENESKNVYKTKFCRRCLRCSKPIRHFNKSGYCSSCASRVFHENQKNDDKVNTLDKTKWGENIQNKNP